MGDTSPHHNGNSKYRNPTIYYIGTLDPLIFEDFEKGRADLKFGRLPQPCKPANGANLNP